MPAHASNPNIREGANGEYVDPIADFGELMFSRYGAGMVLGADILFNGGELLGAGADLVGDGASALGDTLGGL